METATSITVETLVHAPVEKVWKYISGPEHITHWCQASDDWHAPYADNDLRIGGRFKTTMAAKDGSYSFDFAGTYTDVKDLQYYAYKIDDGRFVELKFVREGDGTRVIETFEPESMNSLEMQKGGWQAILDNFKKYTENN